MRSIAIITARGGSKRIPRKNIKDFYGKPIIAYSIEAALASHLFDEVMVSTDDQEIAEIARTHGAKVPFMRSEKTSNDYAGTAEVLQEVLQEYDSRGQRFDWVCCIYPTAPFVTAEKLCDAMKKLTQSGADALIPVVKFSYPPQRCFVMEEKGNISYKWPENINKRSQDLEPLYHDAGQFYFINTDVLIKRKALVPENTVSYTLNEVEVQDIDNEEDWKLAEIKYRLLNRG